MKSGSVTSFLLFAMFNLPLVWTNQQETFAQFDRACWEQKGIVVNTRKFSSCVSSYSEGGNFTQSSAEGLKSFAQYLVDWHMDKCAMWMSYKTCYRGLVQELRKCMDEPQVSMPLVLIGSFGDVVCADNGTKILKFLQSGGAECLESYSPLLILTGLRCLQERQTPEDVLECASILFGVCNNLDVEQRAQELFKEMATHAIEYRKPEVTTMPTTTTTEEPETEPPKHHHHHHHHQKESPSSTSVSIPLSIGLVLLTLTILYVFK